ncbi:carbohydrate porin [Ramlibacter sp. 2FC]|uniref:carbohydrate porin n=1 Tax=Ramlibacter sp. 2FC TaxID=2502188 RepID=UPI0010F4C4B4|nr:carbohydrate porin [Ramlibacter sp. 2FC]
MKTMITTASSILLGLGMTQLAHADVGFNANLELDTTYLNEIKAPATNARTDSLGLGGRVEVNALARGMNGDAFVAGKASLLAKKDGNTAVDDMWVQFGNKTGDVKLGRFEAVDLFPLGKDTVAELKVGTYEGYRANALRGRFSSGVFHGALGLNATDSLRIELGLVETKEAGINKGLRPALTYTNGPLTLRAGLEAVKKVGSTTGSETGLGLSAGYQLTKDSMLNVNFAKKEDDKTFGINATFGPAGLGLVHAKGATAAQKATTVYAAYSFPLMGVKGATITPAVSLAKGGPGSDNQLAARVRINYAF